MEYEQQGFFGNIVSTNGFVAEDDQFTIYYGVPKASPCVETMKEKREGIGGKSPTLLREEERIMHTRFSCAQPILLLRVPQFRVDVLERSVACLLYAGCAREIPHC
jgi:hypothetical protein